MSDRTPPADLAAEQSAIGIALLRREIPPELAELLPTDFFTPATSKIWEVMVAMQAAGTPLDLVTVDAELTSRGEIRSLPGGEAFVLECVSSVPTGENGAHYARIITDCAALRRLIASCAETASRAYGRATKAVELIGGMREQLDAIENRHVTGGPVMVGDEIDSVLAAIEDRALAPERHFIQTGITRFDRFFGGLRPEKLVVVAGPPGFGKSAWAGTVACWNALHKVPALVFSLEMARDELIERYLAAEAKVPNQELSSGRAAIRDAFGPSSDWKAVKQAASRFYHVPLFIDDREAATRSQLAAAIRRWYARQFGRVPKKPEPPNRAFVAIDYLGLVTPDEDDDSDTHSLAIGKITRTLKKLARSLRIPIALMCQLNRGWARRGTKPQLSDLRDSGAIEADADTVIFPWRDAVKNENGEDVIDSSAGRAEWIIPKNRGGQTGSVDVYWAPEYTTFLNLSEEA